MLNWNETVRGAEMIGKFNHYIPQMTESLAVLAKAAEANTFDKRMLLVECAVKTARTVMDSLVKSRGSV